MVQIQMNIITKNTQFWLMKSEPETFSIENLRLAHNRQSWWDGVRNYQARNFMRDQMKKGDLALFYHSNANPSGIHGICQISSEKAIGDFTSWDVSSPYFDPKSIPESPRWFMVQVQWLETFKLPLSLEEIKNHPSLKQMIVAQKGQRLSIQPVLRAHFLWILQNYSKLGAEFS
jgi:predicted RNA-binding protein with PUA-like domain